MLKQSVYGLFVALAMLSYTTGVVGETVPEQVEAILDRVESTGDFDFAAAEALSLFAQVAVWSEDSADTDFIEAAYAHRLLAQLEQVEGLDRVTILKFLRANPDFARVLAFMSHPKDDPSEVFALVDRLRTERGDAVNEYATLAAAICVVHDKPLKRRINENRVKAVDPVELFDYYKANEKRMVFGLRSVPAELLIFVVDSTATLPEMNWALKRYAGHKAVGKLFFDIRYDTAHFRQGSDKKVTQAGYNLPNILEYGGVCADQAYFSVSVGKSIGVPTAYTRGRSAEVSHAWVGFLQSNGKQGWWNFNEGRYSVYKGVRGIVEDPQSKQWVPDSMVSLLGEMIGYSAQKRHAATAKVDAVKLLHAAKDDTSFEPKSLTTSGVRSQPRGTDKASRLTLLENGLRSNPGYAEGWAVLAKMASDGELDLEEKKRWSQVLLNLCGDSYPDFTLFILEPMIRSIEDPIEQDKIWASAAKLFTKRKDLSAQILMAQADIWLEHGKKDKAGRYYEEVVDRYVNDGPFVLDALDAIEKLLQESNKPELILKVYDQTWDRVEVPKRMAPAFRVQSNWYRIGKRYAEKLDEFGYADRAAKADDQIKRLTGG